MLEFKTIELEDKKKVEEYTSIRNSYLCEHCFVDLFIWRYYYNTKICFQDGFLFIKMEVHETKETMYLAPIGKGDLKKAVKTIYLDSCERNIPFIMISITEDLKLEIEQIMPGQFVFKEQRDNADYIYSAEDLITLKGKKLHSKRNYINRFKTTYKDRWEYKNITSENARDIFNYQLKWCELNECNEEKSFLGETCAISQALKNFEALDLRGGFLMLDNNIIAFTLGCKFLDDTFVVQIEKADYTIAGAYQMINNLFAVQNFESVKYVNREEDLGIEGLRKAKLSYNPIFLSTNYLAYIEKDFIY